MATSTTTRLVQNRCRVCDASTEHELVETFISGGARWSSSLQCTACAKAHLHTLDAIVGYDVVETIAADGERVHNVVGHIDGAHRFGEALVAARTYRIGCGYARAIAIYSCGCKEG